MTPSQRQTLSESSLWLIVLASATLIYWPALKYMVDMWHVPVYGGVDYSHGPLLPLVSLYTLWCRRDQFRLASKAISFRGISVVAAALALHWIAIRGDLFRLSLVSLLLFLWGCGFALYGAAVARLLLFPVGYLVFCIPLNVLDTFSFQLRIAAAILSNGILNGIGIASQRIGTAIHSAAGGAFAFDVADPCSGIRSLLALTAIAAAYAYFTQDTAWRKWILFLFSAPIAIAANVARIVSIAVVAQVFGQDAALKLYHDYSGYIVFTVAVLLLMLGGRLVSRRPWLRQPEKGQPA